MNYILRFAIVVLTMSCHCGIAQSTGNPAAPGKKLSANKELAYRFVDEIINAKKIDMVDSIVAPHYIEHQADRHYMNTRYGLKRGLRNFLRAFPDLHVRINFITEEGNIVTAQYTMTGTHTGRMYQNKATNKKINVEGVDIVRIDNGKLVEHWGYMEEAKLLKQLRTQPSKMDENDILMVDPEKVEGK
ncbi:MAG: ester cyclase [Bacteroidota bacterium]